MLGDVDLSPSFGVTAKIIENVMFVAFISRVMLPSCFCTAVISLVVDKMMSDIEYLAALVTM